MFLKGDNSIRYVLKGDHSTRYVLMGDNMTLGGEIMALVLFFFIK